jgi:beta-lactamase class C
MNPFKKFLFFSLTFLFSINAIAFFPINENTKVSDADIVKETANAFMSENHIPGLAILLYVDGAASSYYFGYADREKKKPVTQKTIFEVGSLSKLMTSLLFAQEIDMAKMNLNDSVKKYLPDLSTAFDDISLKELATHTSGLEFNVPKTVQSEVE